MSSLCAEGTRDRIFLIATPPEKSDPELERDRIFFDLKKNLCIRECAERGNDKTPSGTGVQIPYPTLKDILQSRGFGLLPITLFHPNHPVFWVKLSQAHSFPS
jgi:hypothetical protein